MVVDFLFNVLAGVYDGKLREHWDEMGGAAGMKSQEIKKNESFGTYHNTYRLMAALVGARSVVCCVGGALDAGGTARAIVCQ